MQLPEGRKREASGSIPLDEGDVDAVNLLEAAVPPPVQSAATASQEL